jgi:hypothetical protein
MFADDFGASVSLLPVRKGVPLGKGRPDKHCAGRASGSGAFVRRGNRRRSVGADSRCAATVGFLGWSKTCSSLPLRSQCDSGDVGIPFATSSAVASSFVM